MTQEKELEHFLDFIEFLMSLDIKMAYWSSALYILPCMVSDFYVIYFDIKIVHLDSLTSN